MSRQQDYFPPQGTKFKALNYSPWHCDLSQQKYAKLFLHPLNVHLYVDYDEETGMFNWTADITDWLYQRTYMRGVRGNALKACLEAERVGGIELEKHLPRWAKTALKNKWRPPAT
jgi:hypothetical protein